MINITVAQIKNSIDLEENFSSIKRAINSVKETGTDLILFPECALSGFSSKIKDCSPQVLKPYLNQLELLNKETNISIVVPTAMSDTKIYNSGYLFSDGNIKQFFKTGLTPSEESFFSIPEKKQNNRTFQIKNYKVALLICFEAEIKHNTFFDADEIDVILWPGYWNWETVKPWSPKGKSESFARIHKNIEAWRKPMVQSNFAFNDLGNKSNNGPNGLSAFIDSDNTLFSHGDLKQEACYQIAIDKNKIQKVQKIQFNQ